MTMEQNATESSISPLILCKLRLGTIFTLENCQSSEATQLCIFDLPYKLKQSSNYDIGGCYTQDEPDLWFFYTTSGLPNECYLLNLFVCHRKTGNFSVGISENNQQMIYKNDATFLCHTLKRQSFKSAQQDEVYHLMTYNFKEADIKNIKNMFFIPISIQMNVSHALNIDVINSIKLNHEFSKLLTKSNTDFVLKSASGKEYKVHKIFLVSHCPMMRSLIRNNATNTEFIDISDPDMELLIEFIYSGTIKDMQKQNCLKLLEIADKFEMTNLFQLAEFAISTQINTNNAVEIATLSQKYKLEELQVSVFEFIRDNQDVMETDGWKNLKDVDLTKKLFQFIYKNQPKKD